MTSQDSIANPDREIGDSSTVSEALPFSKANKPKINPRRYVWIILGYYLVIMYVRTNSATAQKQNLDFTNPLASKITPDFDSPMAIFAAESSTHSSTDQPEHLEHEGIQIFKVDWKNIEGVTIITLWIFIASLAKIGFHVTPKLGHIFPESCLLIVVGIVIGVFIYTTHVFSEENALLSPHTFFFFMLPPIILDAGYFMPGRLFWGNLGTILLFAVVGTIWNAFAIGVSLWALSLENVFGVEISLLELLLFSTLISAVDPVAVLAVFEEIHVNEILYIIVFGESLLNDAVTIVLYHMFEEYSVMGEDNVNVSEILKGTASFPVVALGGTIVGILWGFLTGFATKYTNHVLVIEPIFVFVMAYLAYLNAELFHLSGVLAITFCGITMKKYVEANICQNSQVTVKYAMKMLSSSSETIIFMFLGVSTVNDNHVWNTWFVVATIAFCTIYRFLGVLWMSALANRFRLNKLNMVDQFVMSYGGLRGAVSFALVLLIDEKPVKDENIRKMFVTTTIAMVFFTVFVQGITIKPFVNWLKVQKAEEREVTMNERLQGRVMDHTLSGIETILGRFGSNKVRDKVKQFDETYIRPYLIRDYHGTAQFKILQTYSQLEAKDALEMRLRSRTVSPVSVEAYENNDAKEEVLEDPELTARRISDISKGRWRKVSEISKGSSRRLSSVSKDPTRKISTLSDDLDIDLSASDIFKPSRKQRKISYSRHILDASDLQPETNWKTYVPVQGRPRRKYGVSTLAVDGDGYTNQSFTMTDERAESNPPSRRVSTLDSPLNSGPPTPNPSLPKGPMRRFSSQTVNRPPTLNDLENTAPSLPGTPAPHLLSSAAAPKHFDYPSPSQPPINETIVEEVSE